MLTSTRLRSFECLWALEWLRVLKWLSIHATKMFKNLEATNEYDKTTLIPAPLKFLQIFRGHEFSEFFHFVNHPKNFRKVATGTRLFRGTTKSTKTRPDGYPTWPEHRVPEFIRYPHTPTKYEVYNDQSPKTNLAQLKYLLQLKIGIIITKHSFNRIQYQVVQYWIN